MKAHGRIESFISLLYMFKIEVGACTSVFLTIVNGVYGAVCGITRCAYGKGGGCSSAELAT
jgi:hypothetical protein